MKYLIFFIMVAPLLQGCRASEKTLEQTQAEQTVGSETDSVRLETKNLARLNSRIEELKNEAEELNVTIAASSKTDSTGKTHQTASATIQYRRKSDQKKEEDGTLTQNTELEAEGSRNTANSQGAKREQRETEHKEKPPERWPYVVIVAVALAIGYGAYRRMKN